jgi:hypothetical protein
MINWNKKDIVCIVHNKKFKSYCFTCNKNLCSDFERIHKKHKIQSIKELNIDEKKLNEIYTKINIYNIKFNDYLYKIDECYKNISNKLKDELYEYIFFYNFLLNISKNFNNYENINIIKNIKQKKLKDFNDSVENNINKFINLYEDNNNLKNEIKLTKLRKHIY